MANHSIEWAPYGRLCLPPLNAGAHLSRHRQKKENQTTLTKVPSSVSTPLSQQVRTTSHIGGCVFEIDPTESEVMRF